MTSLTLLIFGLIGWLCCLRERRRVARCRAVADHFSKENASLIQANAEQTAMCGALRAKIRTLESAPLSIWESELGREPSHTLRAFETIANQPLRTFGGREPQED